MVRPPNLELALTPLGVYCRKEQQEQHDHEMQQQQQQQQPSSPVAADRSPYYADVEQQSSGDYDDISPASGGVLYSQVQRSHDPSMAASSAAQQDGLYANA